MDINDKYYKKYIKYKTKYLELQQEGGDPLIKNLPVMMILIQ
jgi:hypothetical protein